MKKDSVLKKILTNRRLKYGSSAIVIMISSVVLFIVMNMIVSLVPWQLDLTPEGLYSVGSQTTEVLESLDKEVIIYGLFDETKVNTGNELTKVVDLLKKYEIYDNIKVEYVDLNKNIGFITELDPDRILNIGLRDFLVVCGNQKRLIKYFDLFESQVNSYTGFGTTDVGSKAEMAFTSSIYYVSKDERTKIYLTKGHGEYDFDNDYITIGEKIKTNGYDSDTIDLQVVLEIPEDADIIMIANPQSDFSKEEIELLLEFMHKGKSIMITLDSMDSPERYENLQKFLSGYNLAFGYDIIRELDKNFHIDGNQYMIFPNLNKSTIINTPIINIVSKILVNSARSVDILRKSNSALLIEPLLLTSEMALAIDMYDDTDEEEGAKYLAVAVNDRRDDSRIIIIGSADFIQDQRLYYYEQYEGDASRFMLNCINWLEDDSGEIFIETKDYFSNLIYITAQQVKTVGALVIYVMPGIILLIGLAVYLRRRNL